MASIREKVESGSLVVDNVNTTLTASYYVDDCTTHDEAIELVRSDTPTSQFVDGLPLQKRRIQSLNRRGVIADGKWEATVVWSHIATNSELPSGTVYTTLSVPYDTIESFSVTSEDTETFVGKNKNITASWPPDAPETGSRINVDSAGLQENGGAMTRKPSGVLNKTIVLPGRLSNYGKQHPHECIDPEFIQEQWSLVGKINEDSWLGYWPESLLFEGLNANLRDDGNWDVEYTFQFRYGEVLDSGVSVANTKIITNHPDAINSTVHFNISDLQARAKSDGTLEYAIPGWSYVWVMTKERVDAGGKALSPEVIGGYITQLYDKINFGQYLPFSN